MNIDSNISKKSKFIRRIVLISFTAFFVISASIAHSEMLSIKADKVNLRTGPGKDYSVKWEYGSGFPLKIVDRKGEWFKTKDFENDTGWIHKSLLSDIPHAIVKANRNKDEKINIRSGPGSENKIIGKAYYGVVFRVLKHQSGWVKVKHESGITGWISSNLLWGN